MNNKGDLMEQLNKIRDSSERVGFITMRIIKSMLRGIVKGSILLFGGVAMILFGFILGLFLKDDVPVNSCK